MIKKLEICYISIHISIYGKQTRIISITSGISGSSRNMISRLR
uniref:Uncharacterized protein n=1 Tax=Elizabethkingia anophelis TaxID=1117645 RepID=A0A455ZDZ3_9FLAO|nr:TPA_exp: hypothetical protein [Elizabethkingia anophelis]DAC75357.1 TPA_exp: hypothetical protein [Elizabethkingia anophelis]